MMLLPILFQVLTGDFVLPYAWLEHCAKTQVQCEVETVTLADVAMVNKVVNEGIFIQPDVDERWIAFPADRRGDCDDYAVTKRAGLLALGMGPETLMLELGESQRNGKWTRHLVLVVKIDGREWVLDNLVKDEIYVYGKGPYPWRKVGRSGSGVTWN